MTTIPKIRLDHYNIRTMHLDETIRFYRDVVGLQVGYRPSTRPGAWMYDRSDTPVVHITGADAGDPAAQAALDAYLGAKDLSTLQGSGAIDHVAFDATAFEAFRARLQDQQIPFKEREVTQLSLKQLFIEDPNGITVEMNFRSEGGTGDRVATAGESGGSKRESGS